MLGRKSTASVCRRFGTGGPEVSRAVAALTDAAPFVGLVGWRVLGAFNEPGVLSADFLIDARFVLSEFSVGPFGLTFFANFVNELFPNPDFWL